MAFNTLTGIQKVTYAALIGDYIDGTGNVSPVAVIMTSASERY
jgi:hypothetical protein